MAVLAASPVLGLRAALPARQRLQRCAVVAKASPSAARLSAARVPAQAVSAAAGARLDSLEAEGMGMSCERLTSAASQAPSPCLLLASLAPRSWRPRCR